MLHSRPAWRCRVSGGSEPAQHASELIGHGGELRARVGELLHGGELLFGGGGGGALLGQLADLRCDDREALPVYSGPCRFNTGIQCEHIRLNGHGTDDAVHLRDFHGAGRKAFDNRSCGQSSYPRSPSPPLRIESPEDRKRSVFLRIGPQLLLDPYPWPSGPLERSFRPRLAWKRGLMPSGVPSGRPAPA
ncbi:hypothetical protein PM3016_5602 [Paenibacillus mucilaginosus 3016]|uniref:Uncharacterized protein n=1 Tax=Paenibacillus mucilaginosus 3016 TaxID=1116391 RepID=H6NII3_9BACL|nr:hypothetical protein PM3016_5602 [Paenibacillus mucilaginosus 3016]